MVAVGTMADLEIIRITNIGAILDGVQLGEILLPKRFLDATTQAGDSITVFIHRDSQDRLIATTQKPYIYAGECAFLRITQVNEMGAFADIGLDKELLIPFAHQHTELVAGNSYLIYCLLNKTDQRLIGTTMLDKWLPETALTTMQAGDRVRILVGPKTNLGYKVVVNNRVWGLIHSKAIFQPLRLGQPLQGYIETIRPDGKINIQLNKKSEVMPRDAEKIVRYLKNNGGAASFNDKTDPEIIKDVFQMSKGAFKRSIGLLYKNKVIEIHDKGIRLNEEPKPQS